MAFIRDGIRISRGDPNVGCGDLVWDGLGAIRDVGAWGSDLQAAKYLSKARIAGKGGRGRSAAARQLWSCHYGWQNAGDLLNFVEIALFSPRADA